MAKSGVKIDMSEVNDLTRKLTVHISNPLSPSEAKKVGNDMVDEMKDMISKGVSPIKNNGRFPAYRGSYRKGIERGWIKGKTLRPVNLKLTSQFMDGLKSKVVADGRIEIGYFDTKSVNKEKGHREGTNNQALRPTIPQGGEQMAQRIQEIFFDAVNKAIDKLLK